MQEEDFKALDNQIAKAKSEVPTINFAKTEISGAKKEKTDKDQLIDAAFEQAVIHNIQNNEELQNKVLDTAKTYTETKMQTIATDVDTEHKEAVFNNRKDACESYGFNEKTTPIWATKFMSWGYNVMLAIWLFIGTFSFMPVIFIAKKVQVGLKKTWLAIVVAILLYVGVVAGIPLLTNFLRSKV